MSNETTTKCAWALALLALICANWVVLSAGVSFISLEWRMITDTPLGRLSFIFAAFWTVANMPNWRSEL